MNEQNNEVMNGLNSSDGSNVEATIEMPALAGGTTLENNETGVNSVPENNSNAPVMSEEVSTVEPIAPEVSPSQDAIPTSSENIFDMTSAPGDNQSAVLNNTVAEPPLENVEPANIGVPEVTPIEVAPITEVNNSAPENVEPAPSVENSQSTSNDNLEMLNSVSPEPTPTASVESMNVPENTVLNSPFPINESTTLNDVVNNNAVNNNQDLNNAETVETLNAPVPPINNNPTEMVQPTINNTDVQPQEMNVPNDTLVTDTPTQMENSTENVGENIATDKAKNKKNGLIVGIIAAIIVIVALAVVGFVVFGNSGTPKTMFLSTVNKYLENNTISSVSDIFSTFSNGGTVDMDGTLLVKTNNTETINGNFSLKVVDNPNDKQQYYNLKLFQKSENIINLEGILKEDKLYFQLKDIFDKFYYTDSKYSSIFNSNYKTIEDNILSSVNTYFVEEKFVETKEDNLKKISVSMSEKDINDLYVLILENLINDENSLKILEDMEFSKDDIQALINSVKESAKDAKTDKIYIYNVYLKRKETVKQEIIIDNGRLLIEGENSGKITFSVDDKTYITGTFDENNITLNYEEDNNKVVININGSNNSNKDIVEEKYDISINGTEGTDTIDINTSINCKVNKDTSIPEVNINSAKSIDSITDDEMNDIYSKLSEVPIIGELFQSSQSYDYDYSEDYNYYGDAINF